MSDGNKLCILFSKLLGSKDITGELMHAELYTEFREIKVIHT